MEYLIINIKNPELGPQPVHPSVWKDEVTLRDMGYMRYENIDDLLKSVPQPTTTVFPEEIEKAANELTTRKRKK